MKTRLHHQHIISVARLPVLGSTIIGFLIALQLGGGIASGYDCGLVGLDGVTLSGCGGTNTSPCTVSTYSPQSRICSSILAPACSYCTAKDAQGIACTVPSTLIITPGVCIVGTCFATGTATRIPTSVPMPCNEGADCELCRPPS